MSNHPENNLLEKAQKLTQENKLSEAIECYKTLFENEPNQPPHVYVKLGEVYIKSNKLDDAENTFQELKEKYPEQIQGYQRLGQVADVKQNWQLAIERWNEVLFRWPNDLWGLSAKGNALLNLNKIKEAEAIFQELIGKHPDQVYGYEGFAKIAMFQKNWNLALEKWEQVLDKFPAHIGGLVNKGNALLNLNEIEEAEAIFQEIIVKYPEQIQGYQRLGQVADIKQNWELALSRWNEVLSRWPNDLWGLNSKGNALLNLNKIKEAEAIFQELIGKHPDQVNGYEGFAKIAMFEENWNLALEKWQQVLDKFPAHIGGLVNKGNALLNLNEIEEAEAIFQEITVKYPDQIQGYQRLGQVADIKQNWELALSRWNEVLSRWPDDVWGLISKGNALLNLNEIEEAEGVFQELIGKHPDKVYGYEGFAKIAMFQENWNLAIEKYQEVIDKFPDYFWSYNSLANCFMTLGKFQEAETTFQDLITNNPEHIAGYNGLINVAQRLGDWKLALERIEVALEKFPDEKQFWLNKIFALLQLYKFDEALELIQEAQQIFADDIRFFVAESNFYNYQFNYTEGQKILENIKASGKADFGIEMELARQYLFNGQLEKARDIIQSLEKRPESKNNFNYINLYINTLINSKDYQSLRQFFKNNISNRKLLKSVIYDYINLLICQESYNEADQLIKETIETKNDVPHVYKTKICLFLLQEKIKNIREFQDLKNYQEFKEKNKNTNLIYKKLRGYLHLDDNKHERLLEVNDYLSSVIFYLESLFENNKERSFTNSYLYLYDSYEIAVAIIQHIKNKKPFSLIRVGDGEGNFLEYEDVMKKYQEEDQKRSQQLWWGEVKITPEDWSKLKTSFYSSLKNANILGLNDLHRLCRMLPIPVTFSNHGYRGMRAVNNYFQSETTNNSEISWLLTSNYINWHFEKWGLYRLIFSYVKEVSVISCHPNIHSVIEEKYDVKVNKLYTIPSEYRWSHQFNHEKEYEQHYPHYFEKLCAEITVSYPGEVFLVGAGFLGKIYCGIIKEKGGIALDLGSILDYWLNFYTREEENKMLHINCSSFLEKIIKTDPRIQKTEDNLDLKNINSPLTLYKSNSSCKNNIYQPTQLFKQWNLAKKRLFKIIGHSCCGSGFTSNIFQQFGFDIGHEKLGEDGISSWLMTVKDLNAPWEESNISYYTDFDYLIHYLRNPQDVISQIMEENKREETFFNFKRNHILRELNYDIATYETELERAIASFLAWNKIAELQIPDLTLKVEDCVNDLYTFLESKSLSRKSYEEIKEIVIDNKINNTTNKFQQEKPQLTPEDYQNIAPELREGLINFCESYGYDTTWLKKKLKSSI